MLADDPRLTDRTGLARRRPLLRVVLDAGLRLPLDSQLVRTAQGDALVFCGEDVWMGKRKKLEERGVETIQLKESGGRISLAAVLGTLAERQINGVMLEAGARLNAYALDMNLVDKLWLFYAPTFLGADAVPLLANEGKLPPLLHYRLHRFGPLPAEASAQTGLPAEASVKAGDFAVEGYLHDVYRNL